MPTIKIPCANCHKDKSVIGMQWLEINNERKLLCSACYSKYALPEERKNQLATLYFTHDELLALMHAVRDSINFGRGDPVMLNSLDTALTETIWGMEHPRVTPARNEER